MASPWPFGMRASPNAVGGEATAPEFCFFEDQPGAGLTDCLLATGWAKTPGLLAAGKWETRGFAAPVFPAHLGGPLCPIHLGAFAPHPHSWFLAFSILAGFQCPIPLILLTTLHLHLAAFLEPLKCLQNQAAVWLLDLAFLE